MQKHYYLQNLLFEFKSEIINYLFYILGAHVF